MGKTKYVRGGATALCALSIALVVIVLWLAASCGNAENGPAIELP